MSEKLTTSPVLKLTAIIGSFFLLIVGSSYLFTDDIEPSGKETGSQRAKSTADGQGPSAGSEPGQLTSDVKEVFARLTEANTKLEEMNKEYRSLENEVELLKKTGKGGEVLPHDEGMYVTPEMLETKLNSLLAKQSEGSLGSKNMTVDGSADEAILNFSGAQESRSGNKGTIGLEGYDYHVQGDYAPDGEVSWILPEGENETEQGGITGFLEEAKVNLPFESEPLKSDREKRRERLIQYATIDADAIFFGAVALNSLIGVTPSDGGVSSPFQFKVELGQENLATSGVYMPDIALMRFTGFAVGEWSTGCVEGKITSATFVFNDGAIAVITPVKPMGNKDANGAIGYLSDKYGTPCIRGEKHSTLKEYATVAGSLASVASAGQALSNAQFDVQSSPNGIAQAFTGSQLELAAGSGISGGLESINSVIAQRYANVRDIVVAPAGEYVINMTTQLNIDYDPNGRKLINDDFDKELEEYRAKQAKTNNDISG
ncbi:integrating conjugative element protein [Alteromonas sp. KUL42]|uniref:hypothetical protein n=1 Tax=Alteromonas sp. KUL42 TaxID=2480797 RepID=UPI0010361116|nr:hypothetical protein [Alteromonas sp. KUL42]TAP31697.1 hypothetical protein EYR97_19605 [Alteromonas sp. KUL42]GEA09129.1 integrating conjugative element protein [Alteromonas sp. KUL42]